MLTENDDFFHDWPVDLRDWDVIICASIFDQTLDQNALLSSGDIDFDHFAVFAHKSASIRHILTSFSNKINYNKNNTIY